MVESKTSTKNYIKQFLNLKHSAGACKNVEKLNIHYSSGTSKQCRCRFHCVLCYTSLCDEKITFPGRSRQIMSEPESEMQTTCAPSQNAFISIDEFDVLISGSNHDHLTDEIVAALGGIDKMLNEYIRITREYENEELLSRPEMQNITNTISAVPNAPPETIFDKLYRRAKLMDNTFHFSSSDTVWHSICTKHTADRIVSALFSKYIVTVVCVVFFIGMFCAMSTIWGMVPESHVQFLGGVILMTAPILLTFLISAILSCNIPSLVLILTTFDFWVKLGYSIICAVTYAILLTRGSLVGVSGIWLAVYYGFSSITVLLVLTISLIEGLHGNWKVAVMFGACLSLVYSCLAITRTFNLNDFGEQELNLGFGFSIELNEWVASSLRVLSLFLWRQTLMSAYTRGNWCICIYLSPYIKWTDDCPRSVSEALYAETHKNRNATTRTPYAV